MICEGLFKNFSFQFHLLIFLLLFAERVKKKKILIQSGQPNEKMGVEHIIS